MKPPQVQEFGGLPEGWEDYAKTLKDTTDWPRWEIARVATAVLQEMGNDN